MTCFLEKCVCVYEREKTEGGREGRRGGERDLLEKCLCRVKRR